MLKKVIIMVSLMLVLTVRVVMNVKAETVSQKMLENRARSKRCEIEYDFADGIGQKEGRVRAIDFSVECEDLDDGIYDIYVILEIYKKYMYEYHFIYDAYDDYEVVEYGIKDGKRCNMYDFADYMDKKFPELNL